MQQGRARWLTGLAIVTGMAISALPAYAKQTTEPVKITSFSGAYLAARIAEGDNDLDSAIAYYKQALAFDPGDTALAAEPDAVADRARPLRRIPGLCRQAQGSSRCRALLAPGAGGRFLPQEGFHQGAVLAQAVARIRSRPADLRRHVRLGRARRRRRHRCDGLHRQAAGSGLVRPVQVLPSRADRRCLGHARQGRCDLCRDHAGHHRRRCCARDLDAQRAGLCVVPGPQGRQGQGAVGARPGRGVRAGQAGNRRLARQDQPRATRSRPSLPARRTVLRRSCSISPPRSIAAAASRSSASICNMPWP